MSKNDHIKAQGCVTETLGYERYRVELDNGVTILATISGKMRQNHIRVMPGDRVELELSVYDLTRGRITRRFQVKQQ